MPSATTEPKAAKREHKTRFDPDQRSVNGHHYDPQGGFVSGSCQRGKCSICYSPRCTHGCHRAYH